MGSAMRKRFCVCGQRRCRSACTSVQWSGSSLSTNRIIGHYRMYEWRAKTRTLLCACVGWSESTQFCACSKALYLLDAAQILLNVWSNSIDPDHTIQVCRLTWGFAICICIQIDHEIISMIILPFQKASSQLLAEVCAEVLVNHFKSLED